MFFWSVFKIVGQWSGKCKKTKSAINLFISNYALKSDHGRVRTCNPQSRNLIFYPVELRSQYPLNFKIPNSKKMEFGIKKLR